MVEEQHRGSKRDFKEARDKFDLKDKEIEKKEYVFDGQMQLFLHPDIVVRSDKIESAQGSVYFID